ncbi:hypothetical protein KCH_59370 [Kitasatospora cheerisanensis KCTC 2395]|uniref:Uncharacterized protein n=1 Tax=Kitasatospora cheerisanensis KCTC 2395 TaxID=1348663 RepID=A0A066YMD5_9ACTN|nr:hypothetical protein KCH_59370 [Kitasatospora cheerisanensis KCTC 2395]
MLDRQGQAAPPGLLGGGPLARRRPVERELMQHHHAGGHRPGLQLAVHHPLQVRTVVPEQVEVVRGRAEPADVPRLQLGQLRGGPPDRSGPGRAVPGHVAPGVGEQPGAFADPVAQRGEQRTGALPHRGVPAVLTDRQQQDHQPVEHLRGLRAAAVPQLLDRGRDPAVGGAHVAVLVQRPVAGGQHRGRRLGRAGGEAGPDQPVRLAEAGGVAGDEGRVGQPPGPVGGVLAELGGPGQPGHGRQGAAAPGRRLGRRLQHAGHLLVGVDGGRRQVGGTAFEVLAVHLGQRQMGGAAPVRGGHPDHGGAHQRVPEHQFAAGRIDVQQPGGHRRVGVADGVPGAGGGVARTARPVERAQQQLVADVLVEGGDAGAEQALQPPGQRHAGAAEQVVGGGVVRAAGVVRGQLQQGQRVAAGLLQHGPPDLPGEVRMPVVEQACRVRVGQGGDREFGQRGGVEPGRQVRPDRDQQPYRPARQPAADEAAHVGAGVVQPLPVVEDQQQRPLLGGPGQQAQHRDAERHHRRRLARPPAEHGVEHRPGRVVQPRDLAEQRVQQVVQPGVRQPGLHLDARRPDDRRTLPLRHRRGVPQQRALADARLAPQHQRPPRGGRHERRQFRLLLRAAHHRGDPPTRSGHARLHRLRSQLPRPAARAMCAAYQPGQSGSGWPSSASCTPWASAASRSAASTSAAERYTTCRTRPGRRSVTSWSTKVLPSGSANEAKEPYDCRSGCGPGTRPTVPAWWKTPPASWNTSLTSTPAASSSARAATTSSTIRCTPRSEPGAASVTPLPMISDAAEPGGVRCTTRKPPSPEKSTSSRNPIRL